MNAATARSSDSGFDRGDPPPAPCDVCGHTHACYVGGSPSLEAASGVLTWERHVCLGCLMRAGSPDGWSSCRECHLPSPHSATQEARP